ncbi:flagellar hook-associated protein FlgL [Lysinibacillus sp. 2017]|uniref:flagellar hook-associated protein FlgL n=1 Tax=unclassified Lysinibacillus TaxID=2636778 RepID=UPI000D5271F0|nr:MULTISPECIES: flagellar hook-associated protein FlgL [unclassified Lysinibacillus]AWE06384.1 flagellar hook-associated protein FlgL [Lysinibacillus sp. 2017]TGN33390.1 flagellar hook-associated protein FlgL [Lysinibacillus sp. S2017]
MRVTQSMLSSNMLRNLNNSYNKMAKYQNMLESGMKISRPSDDPVVAVKGMGYRVELDKNVQYQRNMDQAHSWLDSTDESLDQVGTVLIRVKELIVQAANDTNTKEEREKVLGEIKQLREHVQDLGNTKVGENYIFSGTKTGSPLFVNNPDLTIGGKILNETELGTLATSTATSPVAGQKSVEINVFDGITVQVNTDGMKLFNDIDGYLKGVEDLLNRHNTMTPDDEATGQEIGDLLGVSGSGSSATVQFLDGITEKVLEVRATVGARQNRLELMENRLSMQEINVTKQMSINEDTDYSKTITDMVTAESIHQAALSVGAKIIQQTLVDFIR